MNRNPMDSTIHIWQRWRNGDEDALNELLHRHVECVERVVRVRMGPLLRRKESVDDLVQEALLDAFEAAADYEPREDARFRDWLARVTESTIRDRVKYWQAQKRDARRERFFETVNKALGEGAGPLEPEAHSTDPGERVSRREQKRRLDACLSELPEHYREVVLLKNYEGGTWEWIAEQIGSSSPRAAEQLHQRARKKLEQALSRVGST